MSESAQPAAAVCAICQQPLAGRFCAHCGEEVLDPRKLTLRHFLVHTIGEETLHLDSKLWRTLGSLLFRPAFLAQEYFAGRRRLYVSPLKLLITAIIVYALLTRGGLQVSLFLGPIALSIAPAGIPESTNVADTVRRIDRLGILQERLEAKRQRVGEISAEKFHRQLEKFAEPLSFANVLLLAIALYALFHRKRRLFAEHGVFSIYFVSFVLFSSLLFLSAPALIRYGRQGMVVPILLAGIIWQFAYLAVAIRRYYFGDDPRRLRPAFFAAALAAMLYVLNSAFLTAVQLLGGMVALWQV